MQNSEEYFKGMRDCKHGHPHKEGTVDYKNGYSDQYYLEQQLTQRTHHEHNKAIKRAV